MKIAIARCHRDLRNGSPNPREYPYWDELIKLMQEDNHIVYEQGIAINHDVLLDDLKDKDLIITIDSFIQHFCWYHGLKAIVLWGPSDPLIFGHKENVNIIKSRSYLRARQFDVWEGEPCNKDAFYTAEELYNNMKENIPGL